MAPSLQAVAMLLSYGSSPRQQQADPARLLFTFPHPTPESYQLRPTEQLEASASLEVSCGGVREERGAGGVVRVSFEWGCGDMQGVCSKRACGDESAPKTLAFPTPRAPTAGPSNKVVESTNRGGVGRAPLLRNKVFVKLMMSLLMLFLMLFLLMLLISMATVISCRE